MFSIFATTQTKVRATVFNHAFCMITQENLPTFFSLLQFEVKDHVYSKYFPTTDCYVRVDFEKKEIFYPEYTNGDKDNSNGMVINERQTCNFSLPENFVVLECVHRLLEKGYLPASIELEPKWKVGHGASGGRADILVRNQERKPLLLVECKTAGNEFKKAWKKTQQDGGQLFSYVQQIPDTQYLCLYASELVQIEVEKAGKTIKEWDIKLHQQIIAHRDNPKILADDKNLLSFEKAKNVKERFEV
jgi:hypothetical protein